MSDKWIGEFLRTGILPQDVEDTIAEFINRPDQVEQAPNSTFYDGFLRYMRLDLKDMENERIRGLKENLHHHFRFLGAMKKMGWDKEVEQ